MTRHALSIVPDPPPTDEPTLDRLLATRKEPPEPTDINLLIIEDIKKRDWGRVHIEADRRAPIILRLRRWFYSSPQKRGR